MANRDLLAPPIAAKRDERDEEQVEESSLAAFGAWYEAQPSEWIAAMDEIGRKGPVAPRS